MEIRTPLDQKQRATFWLIATILLISVLYFFTFEYLIMCFIGACVFYSAFIHKNKKYWLPFLTFLEAKYVLKYVFMLLRKGV